MQANPNNDNKDIFNKIPKSFFYTMSLLHFAHTQFFAAFGPVPTLYKTIYPSSAKDLLEKELADIQELFEVTHILVAVAQTAQDLDSKKTILDKAKKTLADSFGDEDKTLLEESVKEAQAAFDAADKAAKEAKDKMMSSIMKALKIASYYCVRFAIQAISTPFWIALQALNFVGRIVVALASLVAVVPTAGVEGVAYAVNGMISGLSYVGEKIGLIKPKEKRTPQTPQGAGADVADVVDPNAGNKTDKKEPEVKPDYTLANLVEEAILVKKSAVRKAAKALKNKADTVFSEEDQAAITAQCSGLADAKKHTHTLAVGPEDMSADAVVEQIKVYLASHGNTLPQSGPKMG